MVNYKSSFSNLEKLDEHEATGTESTYTFTKSLDMTSKYRTIIIYMTGQITATLYLKLIVNGDETGYQANHLQAIDTTVSATEQSAETYYELMPVASLPSNYSRFSGKIEIFNQNTANGMLQIHSKFGYPAKSIVMGIGELGSVTDTITSITISTSTSTWKLGTQITTYGLKY